MPSAKEPRVEAVADQAPEATKFFKLRHGVPRQELPEHGCVAARFVDLEEPDLGHRKPRVDATKIGVHTGVNDDVGAGNFLRT
ncbi:hypothetical protein RM52_01870 [Microbacterium hominis]|uniref:Uncharacterized protein n=1 Tax=Microbacterium hominis TaxID=162426 RepID=A0A0B4CFV9_9MICO|nr:hypothetical protein RM52_01870 [Microbacterium hominis]